MIFSSKCKQKKLYYLFTHCNLSFSIQAIPDNTNLTMEAEQDIEDEEKQDSLEGGDASEVAEQSIPVIDVAALEKEELRKRTIPPPGPGKRIYEIDPMLMGFREHLDYR